MTEKFKSGRPFLYRRGRLRYDKSGGPVRDRCKDSAAKNYRQSAGVSERCRLRENAGGPSPVKREAGENPARTRHCNEGANVREPVRAGSGKPLGKVFPGKAGRERGTLSQETCPCTADRRQNARGADIRTRIG